MSNNAKGAPHEAACGNSRKLFDDIIKRRNTDLIEQIYVDTRSNISLHGGEGRLEVLRLLIAALEDMGAAETPLYGNILVTLASNDLNERDRYPCALKIFAKHPEEFPTLGRVATWYADTQLEAERFKEAERWYVAAWDYCVKFSDFEPLNEHGFDGYVHSLRAQGKEQEAQIWQEWDLRLRSYGKEVYPEWAKVWSKRGVA
ncbi:MAG TPA: hypothetical protein VEK08_07110 [Planctomycetota bacterium]|nr:hypothetical protein [Planctomycetota bacterium]